ncbi:phosphotransferase family protein [Streptomyces brasiliensis]|uniref:Acyl-CoA dehydrogenase n=1 Tax=Streptomyces brasiliensis TaxID=1954 RepID=A0A917P5H4_9ACTN|nr:phosphotransferase family protein [Streptomyces brasiliensis]GGJ62741.1 acyl-CoA dehydrogenase [Streptomyces brasiliensis]
MANPSVGERPAPGADVDLDVAALQAWLAPGLGAPDATLTAVRMGTATGIGNALFALRLGDQELVLRRPPAVLNHPSASNMVREWRILTALEGTLVPHPTPRALCEDTAVVGVPFLVMDKVEGFTPGFALPEPFASDATLRRDLAHAYVDALVDLAAVDWRARGLEGLGKPEGFLERQVSRWLGQLDQYRTRDLPELDFLTEWLEANRPQNGPIGLMHGDYSPFNIMVAPESPGRLAAVIDWDTGTIGDPLLDIGHLLARWTDPGEEPVIDAGGPPVDYGVTRAELAARYAERSHLDTTDLPYYAALALFKLAVILEGTYHRQARAGVPEAENTMARIVPGLFTAAAEFARGRRALQPR